MSLSLYRKYRPRTFSEVIGQKHIVQTLSNAIVNDRISHAYLFTGPRGTGKTSLARIFAAAVNCLAPKGAEACMECEVCKNINEGKSLDIFEIDAASNTGVDNIRELRENVKFPPSQTKYKIYIIDEVHMLSAGAFNALLKTLEEPPAHVIFILATTEIHKVPETIVSRCQRFDFARLTIDQIIEKLSRISKSEKISVEKEALEMIAIAAQGGMRDAESILSQMISLEDKNITAAQVSEALGTIEHESLFQMSQHLLEKNSSAAIELINKLSENGNNLEFFNKSLLNTLRQLMLIATDKKLAGLFSYELTKRQLDGITELANGHSPYEILKILDCFSQIQSSIRSAYIPQLPLEMAVIKSLGADENISSNKEKTNIPKINNRPPAKEIEKEKPSQESDTDKKNSIGSDEKQTDIETNSEDEPQASKATFTLSDVKKAWGSAMAQIKPLNHSLASLLPNCQPLKVENGILTIAAKFAFHKDILAQAKNKLTVETVFDKILGSKIIVKAVTFEEAGIKIQPSTNSSPSPAKEEKSSETSSLLTDAMGILGGQIVG
jgi:DNA polymerase-3 subunit gamma/tau